MKRLLLVAVVGLIVAFGFVPQQLALLATHFTVTVAAQEDPAKITVYITRTGEKYHRDGCRYLRQSRVATSLKDAVGVVMRRAACADHPASDDEKVDVGSGDPDVWKCGTRSTQIGWQGANGICWSSLDQDQ